MIRNLKISHRPVLLGIVFSVRSPCCCSYSSRSKNRDRLRPNKRRGIEYIKPVRQLLYDIQKHQVVFLSAAADASAPERQILEDIRSAQEVDGRYGKEFQTTHGLAGSAEKWASTKSLILRNSSSAKPETSIRYMTASSASQPSCSSSRSETPRISSWTPISIATTRRTPSSRKCPSLCNDRTDQRTRHQPDPHS